MVRSLTLSLFKYLSTRRLVVGMFFACLATLTGLHSAHAQFALDGRFYQIRQVGTASQLFRLDRSASPYVSVAVGASAPANVVLNALAYSSVTNYMYAIRLSTGYQLYRIEPTGPVLLGAVTGLPNADYNSGTMDGAGNYYVTTLTNNTIYRIDVNTRVAVAVPLSRTVNSGDFAINPIDGRLYAISATANPAVLSVIDINSAAATKPVAPAITITGNSANTFGSVFFDPVGTFYAYENGGSFYQINTTTGAATLISTAPSTSQSDGAISPFTREKIDAVKSLVSVSTVAATTFDVTFQVTVGNTGAIFDPNVQVNEAINRAFVSGSPTVSIQTAPAITAGTALPLNPAFNGTTDTRIFLGTTGLAPGASTTFRFTVRAAYPNVASIPATQSNTVYASASTLPNAGYTFPGGTPVPPIDLVAADASSPFTLLPPTPNGDTPGGTPFAYSGGISGRVFEDVNYGGGAGRPITAAGTAGVNGVRVELYNPDGTFNSATSTANIGGLDGSYAFIVAAAAGYTVRVVNSTVQSTRGGSIAALRGVQTFRVNSGTADGNRVGGQVPSVVDAGNGVVGTSIGPSGVLTGTQTGQAQSIAVATSSLAGTTGVDFGFNFDTVVNTNNSGQGSLAQFVTNASTLTNGGLSQVGQTAGKEASIFMISNGGAQAGFSGQSNLLTGGVAVINATTLLPQSTGDDTIITGVTQTTNVGNTNTAVLGVGGTVGVGALGLSTVSGPEVQLQDGGGLAIGLDLQANRNEVHGFSIYGFGNTANSGVHANIRIGTGAGTNFTGTSITNNLIGTSAISFSLPGGGSGGDNIRSEGADGGTVQNNLVGFSNGKGVALQSGSDGWLVENNEVRGNAIGNDDLDGLAIEGSANSTVRGNLFINNLGVGVDSVGSSGNNTFINNTSAGNGTGDNETAGLRVFGTGNRVELNIIRNNYGAGVMVASTATVLITQNSIFDNGESANDVGGGPSSQLGIDLLAAGNNAGAGTAPFVTINDNGDGDAGGNGLLNMPVFETAELSGGTLRLRGWSRPGATIELFIANPDASGFGEGQTYLVTLTEGVTDADATTSAYNDPQAGTDNTNRFDFSIAVPGGVALGTVLTATATIASQTSEFSENVIVTAPAPVGGSINGRVYLDANRNATYEDGDTPTGLAGLFVKVLPPVGNAIAVVPVDAVTGLFTAPVLPDGTYSIVLSNNNNAADRTAVLPPGYVGTEAASGSRTNIVIAGGNDVDDQNFGLFNGSQITGRVFRDSGAGGGTANDGILNGAETGIPGVAVVATNGAGTITYSNAVTDAEGRYSLFVPASAGATPVRVVETNLASYVSTGASVGNTGGTYVRATDVITFTNTVGTSYSGLNFGDILPSTFISPGTQTTTPGNIALYPHTFTPGTSGALTFAVTHLPLPSAAGWSQIIFRDTNNNGVLDPGEPAIGGTGIAPVPVAVVGGVAIGIIVQDFAPATVTNGATNTITVTATLDPTGAGVPNEILTLTDVTRVGVDAVVVLSKMVDKLTALPGEILTYVITYQNTGTQPITTLIVTDTTPAFTRFVSAAYATTPPGLTNGTLVAPPVAGRGPLQWNFAGTLAGGQSGSVTFQVRVDN